MQVFACDISPFHLPAGLEGDTDVQFLLMGGELVKVRSTSWKKMRYFKLQEDCKTIWHESHKKFKRDQTCECGRLMARVLQVKQKEFKAENAKGFFTWPEHVSFLKC